MARAPAGQLGSTDDSGRAPALDIGMSALPVRNIYAALCVDDEQEAAPAVDCDNVKEQGAEEVQGTGRGRTNKGKAKP